MAKPLGRTDAAPVTLVALNAAASALVEEILRLPSAAAVTTVIDLLYGRDLRPSQTFLDRVGTSRGLSLATVLASRRPLARVLPTRLRPSATWRVASNALKNARANARTRYRDLQAAFVALAPRATVEPAASLARYTFGTPGRHGQWAETAGRVLDRVVTVNRALLELLGDAEVGPDVIVAAGVDMTVARAFDLPPSVLALIATAAPPLAVPDFDAFVDVLAEADRPLDGDESVARYQSLFAEILGLHAQEALV
ncbi:MAG: hypothetical protein HY216_03820 [Candidatus Rokubacteria bacterium]|nr:hypothetical protein [Candidatus Rokubacteria bacterium]